MGVGVSCCAAVLLWTRRAEEDQKAAVAAITQHRRCISTVFHTDKSGWFLYCDASFFFMEVCLHHVWCGGGSGSGSGGVGEIQAATRKDLLEITLVGGMVDASRKGWSPTVKGFRLRKGLHHCMHLWGGSVGMKGDDHKSKQRTWRH